MANNKNSEEQLQALREHLLELVKTEAKLKDLQENSENSDVVIQDVSIIEVLQLWQRLFRETFQQYHRLSTQLVQSQNSSAALRLWKEYLIHIQSFLSDSIPDDYSSLKEHKYLCEVHKNLLTSQHAVFSTNDGKDFIYGNDSNMDVKQEFDVLNNLHKEIITRLITRHIEIETRLTAWIQYQNRHKEILVELQNIEKERFRLQLRYLHLKTIPRNLQKIEDLLIRLSVLEQKTTEFGRDQEAFLNLCDNNVSTSIRMEFGSIKQRISNLQAALETWIGFMNKIVEMDTEYDREVKVVQHGLKEAQRIIDASKHNIERGPELIDLSLANLVEQKQKLHALDVSLDCIEEVHNQMKEYVSPYDVKIIKQMIWLLSEQKLDCDQQISNLINQIEEKLSKYSEFINRYNRINEWLDEIAKRVNLKFLHHSQDPDDILYYLDYIVQSEINLKENEKNWIISTGDELVTEIINEEETQHEIRTRIEMIVERWNRIIYVITSRSSKIKKMLLTINKLESRITKLRAWLYKIEYELSKPIVLEDAKQETFVKIEDSHDELQRSIESESANFGEVLNLCEMLLSDIDHCKINLNITNITSAIDSLENRWKSVCETSTQRKQKILMIWNVIHELIIMYVQNCDWLGERDMALKKLEETHHSVRKSEIKDRINAVETEIDEIQTHSLLLNEFEQKYATIVKTNGLDLSKCNEISGSKEALATWQGLMPRSLKLLEDYNRILTIYKEFLSSHESTVIKLTQLDVQLTNIEHLTTETTPTGKTMGEIKNFIQDFNHLDKILATSNQLGTQVLETSITDDASTIQSLMSEYQNLHTDIASRLGHLRIKYPIEITTIDESCQVETLKFEQDEAVQVNTLTHLTQITQKDAFIYELQSALKECQVNLDKFEDKVRNPTTKFGTQSMHKLIATCQSSVELIEHLSRLLIIECHCTNQEAEVERVAELSSRFDLLRAICKEKEEQLKEIRYVCFIKITMS